MFVFGILVVICLGIAGIFALSLIGAIDERSTVRAEITRVLLFAGLSLLSLAFTMLFLMLRHHVQ